MSMWNEMTCADALARWDAGDSIWSCELGGLGPGYEQCIHLMGMEMLRAMCTREAPDWTNADERAAFAANIENDPAVSKIVSDLGPSGAQHGAAMNIAFVFYRNGYAKGMDMVPEDRRIQVSRTFPSVAP